MAESYRKVSKILKTADLVAQLEKMKVADHPLLDELSSETEGIENRECEPVLQSRDDVECDIESRSLASNGESSASVNCPKNALETQTTLSSLYPKLEPDFPEETGTEVVTASAPLPENIRLESAPSEYSVPSPVTMEVLNNLYVNQMLDAIDSIELEFLKDVSNVYHGALVANEDRDFFQVLVNSYVHCWSQWQHAMDRFQMVRRDITQLKAVTWKVSRKTSKVSGKCQDGVSVSYEYVHEESILDESVSNEITETQDIMLWIVFEELPEIAYDLSRLRNRISEHLLTVLLNTDVYRKIVKSEPIQLLRSDMDMKHIRQIADLKWIISVLFAALRQHCSSEFHGQTVDPSLEGQLRHWLLLTAGTMIRFCRAEDHLFVLMHILRLPSRLLKPLSALVHPPDPNVVWHRSSTVSEFLEQPEIQLHLTMFGACLRPVRNRTQFLLATSSETKDIPGHVDLPLSHQSESDSAFLLLDSGGETDSEQSLHTSRANSVGAVTFSRTNASEPTVFVGPKDLDRVLKQLNLVRLIKLLDVQPNDNSGLGTKESGLMTLIAFANRIMNLIESCGEIYSHHLQAPKSRDHLASWRILTKRLASIISALVTAVGSRVRLVWYQYTQTEQQQQYGLSKRDEVLQVLSQYDAFCLRCTKCLLSGCGLPSTHQDAVRLIGWRCLARLFPFGLAFSRSKVEFLYLIINSLLPFGTSNSVPLAQLPDYLIGPLHRSLLSIELNDIGLSSIIMILGNLASVECRPVHVPANIYDSGLVAYPKELPQLEAALVRAVTIIIFGLSVYHYPDATGATSPTSHKGTGPIGLLPIAPDHGRRQLVNILYVHPEISLEFLFHMIMTVGKHISSGADLSTVIKKKAYAIGPYYAKQCFGTEELLLLLANEAPFDHLRPSADDVSELISWLVNQEPKAFTHVLSRTLLCRLSWESYLNLKSGEPFLALPMQLNFAVGLARLSEKQIQRRTRFASIQNHPIVEHILNSTKSTASSATNLLLASLGYRRLSLELPLHHGLKRDAQNRPFRSNSRRASFAPQRSRSQDPVASDGLFSMTDPVISWCINMVTRLHLPGCAINFPQEPLTDAVKTELMRAWKNLLQLNSDRNPVIAFLLLSIHSVLFASSESKITPYQGNIRTIFDSLDWKLILRTLSIIFHRYTTVDSTNTEEDPGNLVLTVAQLFKPTVAGHLQINARSFTSLFVGCSLDACLHQPHKCSGLIKMITLSLLDQPDWLTRPDSLNFLEWMLLMDLWISQNYIPTQFGGRGNILNWLDSQVCCIVKRHVQMAYIKCYSDTTTSWSEQFGTVASAAWRYSSHAISVLKARVTGAEPPSDVGLDSSYVDNLPVRNKSLITLFWRNLRQIQPPNTQINPSFSWWLITLIHSMDLVNQSVDSMTLERTNVPSNTLSGAWLRLSPILLRNVNELAVSTRKSPIADASDGPLPLRLALLLERVLLEAGLLSPTIDMDKPIADALCVSLFGRLRSVLSQLAIIQSVSLIVACPPQNPVFSVLLQLLLRSVFASPDEALANGTAQLTKFPTGLLLLHCLPWSFCNIGCTTSETAFLGTNSIHCDGSTSLLSILIEKIRWVITELQKNDDLTDSTTASQPSLTQVLRSSLELLDGLRHTIARDALVEPDGPLLALRRTAQIELLNGLASTFNWSSITTDLQTCAELWGRHRQISAISNDEVQDNLTTDRSGISPAHRPLAVPLELPYYSLESLVSNSFSSCIPKTVSVYPKSIQELRNNLFNWTKAVCDQIAQLQLLHQAYTQHLLRHLYVVTTVRESKHVECQSILPTWVHSKKCLGGAYLTFEYQTAVINEKVHTMCLQNAAKSDELLDALVQEVVTAACSVSDELSPSLGKWSQYGLQIEALVSNLIALSTQVSMSGTLYPSPSNSDTIESVKAVGMQCFEQLCQNLSGPLLTFPVSKKVLAECIRQLAEEFLTSFTAAHERVLDLMVALPHLSGVLAPTFVPPKPALSGNPDEPHPLTSVFERLIDVRVRCSAEAAWDVLKQIDLNAWCVSQPDRECPPPTGSPKQFQKLLAALYGCLKQTSLGNTKGTLHDVKLQELYFEFLQSLLRNRLSESLAFVMELLMDDICTQKSQPLWVIIHRLLVDEKQEFGKCTVSVEKLLVVLNTISAHLAKPSQRASGFSGTISDEFLLLPFEYVQTVLAVFQTLLSELGTKLGCCVREGHTSCACAIPPLFDNMIGILGRILIRGCVLTGSSESGMKEQGITLIRAVLGCISEVLTSADEACPTEYDLPWSSRLVDCLIKWILLAHCPASRSEQNFTPGLRIVPLVVRLYASKSGNSDPGDDVCSSIHLPWSSWHPSTHTLDSMVAVLNWCSGSGRDLHLEQPAALFILLCFRHVHWDSKVHENSWTYTVTDQAAPPRWHPGDSSRETEFAMYLGSLTFLCMLLVQSLRDSETQIKNSLQNLIETILSTFDVSEVGERCYAYILSHMDVLRLPAHTVLMPPTSLEGRLFGLLASAGGMTASSPDTPHRPPNDCLYPELDTLVSKDTCALRHKRLCYLKKVIGLLQYTLLRGQIPVHEVEALKTGPLALNIVQSMSESTGSQTDSLFIRLLAQPMGSLFKRLLKATPSPTSVTKHENGDQDRILTVLGCLRIGNLLSELEAVAAASAWADPTTEEFESLSEMCTEVMSLIHTSAQQSITSEQLTCLERSAAEHRLNLVSSAIIFWILGEQSRETGVINQPDVSRVTVMPRSIHARLSKPMCHTVLTHNTPTNQISISTMVRVLEACTWSILTLAPNSMSFMDRLANVNAVFMQSLTRHSTEAFVVSNSFIYGCLREASLLPLFCLAVSRAKRFSTTDMVADGPQILLADIFHWLTTTDWKFIIPESPAKLSGFFLMLSFIAHSLEKRTSGDNSVIGCCDCHPAWKCQSSTNSGLQKHCMAAVSAKQFVSVLAEIRKALGSWKMLSGSDNEESDHFVRLLNFVNCIGSLVSSWIGTDPDGSQPLFEPLLLSQSGKVGDQPCTGLTSLVPALLARLPNFNLTQTITYVCNHFWPDLHPCIKAIISSFEH